MKLRWRIATLKNGFQDATAYQLEFLIEILGYALVPACIQWLLWYAMFQLGGASEVAGMTYQDMIHYTWMSLLFSQVRGGDHDFELSEMIRTGQLSNYLLRPVGVVEFVYIRGVSARLFIAALSLSIGILASFYFDISAARMLGAMLLALVGNVIHYQIGATLATTAFLWEEAYSVLMMKNMITGLLCGELIPLNLFPESMQWIWKYTPFYLYVFGPTQYAMGKWTNLELLQHMSIGMGWILVGWIAIRLTWSKGIQLYQSLGG